MTNNFKMVALIIVGIIVLYIFNLKNNLSEKDKEAFKTMNLRLNDDWPTIQKKFKSLVKKFHPDKNPDNKIYEDKLKKITLAYSHIRSIINTKKI